MSALDVCEQEEHAAVGCRLERFQLMGVFAVPELVSAMSPASTQITTDNHDIDGMVPLHHSCGFRSSRADAPWKPQPLIRQWGTTSQPSIHNAGVTRSDTGKTGQDPGRGSCWNLGNLILTS